VAFCSQCGNRTITGDRFCRQCGAPLDEPVPPASPHPPAAAPPAPARSPDHPDLLQFAVDYPPRLSRLLIFVKWLLAVPHYVVALVYALAFYVVVFLAWWAILFTGRYPSDLFSFATRFLRYTAAVTVYLWLMRDDYPPFSGEAGRYPLRLEVPYPGRLSRGLIFIKWLLAIPNWLVLQLVLYVAYLAVVVAWFAILFTGRFPPGLFRFVEGALRWNYRALAYIFLLTDRYPPFTTAPVPDASRPQYAAL
jgi:hypothetical protein